MFGNGNEFWKLGIRLYLGFIYLRFAEGPVRVVRMNTGSYSLGMGGHCKLLKISKKKIILNFIAVLKAN